MTEERDYFWGWTDGVQSVVDAWDEILENSEGETGAFGEFKKWIEARRKEIEAL